MSVEGVIARPTGTDGRPVSDDARESDPYRFLSTRLVRELIAADARIEAASEEGGAVAASMLGVVAEGLAQPGMALLDAAGSTVVASCGLEPEERDLLVADPPTGGASLARRALEERRVFLLGSGSREPLLPALREIRREWTGLVLVPLCDRDRCAGILAMLSAGSTLPAAFLRSLAPAFRLLTLLLHPGRRAIAGFADAAGTVADPESCALEIEELRAQLAEARDRCRGIADEESSSQAALRAESESLRARVAELEAVLATGDAEEGHRQVFEAECARLSADLEAHVSRIETLEGELDRLREQVEQAERARREAEEALRDVRRGSGRDGLEPAGGPMSIPGLAGGPDLHLGAIAEAAAAAIGDGAEPAVAATELIGEAGRRVDGAEPAVAATELTPGEIDASPPASDESCPALGLWHFDSDPTARVWAGELAEQSGGVLWSGDGEPPRTTRRLLVVNLFDESVGRAIELVQADADLDSLVYAADPESAQGFELGRVGWVRRPLDPVDALARIRSRVPKRLGGIVIVSARLRELAGLRQALAEIDAAGSVACDIRQATDLLEIVRRPDAVLIDLLLEGGQGLALARQLRTAPETSDVPILFLLPETLHASALRADAERAGVLGPYDTGAARRLVNSALAHVG